MRILDVMMGAGLAAFLGCGGSVDTVGGSTHDGGSIDAKVVVDTGSSTVDAGDAGHPDAGHVMADDAGHCSPSTPPDFHRASAEACPTARGVGSTTSGAPPSSTCTQDSDCTAGKNGRCLAVDFTPMFTCSYDDCFSDSDCPGDVACVCRLSATDVTANTCATGSNCRLDSDCGPCGYCSPTSSFFAPATYFCHTPDDACVNDADCAQDGGGCQRVCNYDSQAGHWACMALCPP